MRYQQQAAYGSPGRGDHCPLPALFDARPLGIVVGEEAKVGGIRDICSRRGVEHLDFTEMLAAEGLSVVSDAAT